MRRITFVSLVVLALGRSATADPLADVRVLPSELEWKKINTGNERATVAGDDSKEGLYAYRIRFPANAKLAPHFHPDDRVGTVLSGTLYFGYGTEFSDSDLRPLQTGSSWTEPANNPHFAWAKDGEVVIQVVGVGPSGTKQVAPK